jgi:hypothetical protein
MNPLHFSPTTLQHLGDPNKALIVTESVPKADAAAAVFGTDSCSIGQNGVFGFRGTNSKGGKTASDDFNYEGIAWKQADGTGRVVYLIPDSDFATNLNVKSATNRLAKYLRTKGANVKIVQLPVAK